MKQFITILLLFSLINSLVVSCSQNTAGPSKDLISQLNLHRGEIISCGATDKEFGTVNFNITGSKEVQNEFNTAMELLHSFEYEEAEKAFARIIDNEPQCVMAYWGVAMCNFHPLWEPPSKANLEKGTRAIAIALSIKTKTPVELGFIDAVASYYSDSNLVDAHTRSMRFEKAMEVVYRSFPQLKEAAVFYALALDASALPSDKTYTNQKKAGTILDSLYSKEPNHPGIIHYIIHTNDYPGLALRALTAARRYASVAPSSAHAQHMPSHIFTRLGLWDESVRSNLQSVSSARCYATSAGIRGHWDEELHGLDYLVYAYLQKGQNDLANEQLKLIAGITDTYPANFKVAYAFAAIPARIALENRNWNSAAALQLHPYFSWNKFPWQEAIIHFARLLGSANTGNLIAANDELLKLTLLHDTLENQKEFYKSNQVAIQQKEGQAWIIFAEGEKKEALYLMKAAAEKEDSTEKHPVTPCEVIPARELYADMLFQMHQNEKALEEYEITLTKNPNRFNSLFGAGIAAANLHNKEKTRYYFRQLLAITGSGSFKRHELNIAKSYLNKSD